MKKLLVLLLTSIISITFLSGCTNTNAHKESTEKVSLDKVKKIDMEKSFILSGNLEGNKETIIAAKTPGQLASIKVNIGDNVLKNQILANLTAEENYTARNTAYNSYQNSISNTKKTSQLLDKEISLAQTALKTAEEELSAITTAESDKTDISLNQEQNIYHEREMLQLNLDSIDKTFAQKTREIINSAVSASFQNMILVNNILSYLYSINDENLEKNNEQFDLNENFIVKTESNENDAESEINRLKNIFYDFQDYYQSEIENKEIDEDKVSELIYKTKELSDNAKNALQKMNIAITDSVDNQNASQAYLDNIKFTLNNYTNQIQNLLLSQEGGIAIGIDGIKNALNSLNIDKKNKITEINKKIDIANNQLELIKNSNNYTDDDLESKIKLSKLKVEQAKLNLEKAKKTKEAQLQKLNTQTDLSLGSYNMTNVKVANSKLKAPYNGVVVEKYVEEGSIINIGTPVLKIADTSSLKLVVYVPESQIKYISTAQIALAASDSFPDEEFEAKIERISPKSELDSKKIRVELSIQTPDYLKIGMSMNLKFNNINKKEVIGVNNDSIKHIYGQTILLTVEDDKVKYKPIQTGDHNDQYTEILSGIELNDEIISHNIENIKEGDNVEIINNQ